MSFASAALVEPISVSLGGVQRSDLKFGQPVIVCGAGPIGLMALAVARAAGAYPILVTDIAEHKLETATQLGADFTVCCGMKEDPHDIAKRIREAFDSVAEGLQPEIALECTGVQSSLYSAAYGEQRHCGRAA